MKPKNDKTHKWVVERFYDGDRLAFIRRRYVKRTHISGKANKRGVQKKRRQTNHQT